MGVFQSSGQDYGEVVDGGRRRKGPLEARSTPKGTHGLRLTRNQKKSRKKDPFYARGSLKGERGQGGGGKKYI